MCALCLLHETDLVEYGIARTGLTTTEHFIPQSVDPHQSNIYANCLYACRFCNQARSNSPLHDDKGNRLLDPTSVAWAAHFETRNDELVPKTDDGVYTMNIYALNDPLKVERRAARRKHIKRCRELLRDGPAKVERLMSRAQHLAASDDPVRRQDANLLRDASAELDYHIALARRSLERYRGIPHDADPTCRCRIALHLPPQLEQQLSKV
jgi:hypothetical protein